jgi:hypothetical protein
MNLRRPAFARLACIARLAGLALTLAALVAPAPRPAWAQRVPLDEYIRYVPLEYPRVMRQSPASDELNLYGRPSDPGFVDEAPHDGIDDRRAAFLLRLGARFSPLMVQNTHSAPMDAQRFTDAQGRLWMHVDTWNLGTPKAELARRDSFDVLASTREPCGATGAGDDCRLLELLRDFHPDHPASAVDRARAVEPGRDDFRVFYLDFPGGDAKSWKEAYEDPKTHALRPEYRDRVAIHVHPFAVAANGGYELVLQYWFFYPFNDGGNNHLGDWEHLNVVVQRRGFVAQPWTAEDLRAFLAAGDLDGTDEEQLVIRRLDYYFHSKVMTLDFTVPNAYAPKAEWQRARDVAAHEGLAREWILDAIRFRAWRDAAETEPNTHPVVYIGADNKGTDQILSSPGGTNQDSHGSYPFIGLFRDIGPAAAAEKVGHELDHRRYFALPTDEARRGAETFGPGGVLAFDESRLRLMPDFEAVLDRMESDAEIRRRWYWLILPLRYGYPCVASPMAGIVAHAETGNLAVVGGSFNAGWNGLGATSGFARYEAHALPGYFPTAWQDQFDNHLGWLNLTYPTLSLLPPIDLLWWGVAAPVRAVADRQERIFFPNETVPPRFFGIGAGVSGVEIQDDFLDLLYNRDELRPLVESWLGYLVVNGVDSTTRVAEESIISENAWSPYYRVNFYVGRRFSSENSLRHSRSTVGADIRYTNIPGTLQIRSELNMWDLAGSLRYNLLTEGVLPYAKVGYGLSWYRLENVTLDGVPLRVPDSPWIRKPSFSPMTNLLPNTLHAGAGVEWFVVRGRKPSLPAGTDLTLRADWTMYSHSLGLSFDSVPVEDLIGLGFTARELPRERHIVRHAISLGAALSF